MTAGTMLAWMGRFADAEPEAAKEVLDAFASAQPLLNALAKHEAAVTRFLKANETELRALVAALRQKPEEAT